MMPRYVAYLSLDLRLGNESGHGVDHDDVQTARADEHVGDLEGLLTGVRLGDEKVVGVNAQGLGVHRVKSMRLGVVSMRRRRKSRGEPPVSWRSSPPGSRSGGGDQHNRKRVSGTEPRRDWPVSSETES